MNASHSRRPLRNVFLFSFSDLEQENHQALTVDWSFYTEDVFSGCLLGQIVPKRQQLNVTFREKKKNLTFRFVRSNFQNTSFSGRKERLYFVTLIIRCKNLFQMYWRSDKEIRYVNTRCIVLYVYKHIFCSFQSQLTMFFTFINTRRTGGSQ